jgi:hypothetical protein
MFQGVGEKQTVGIIRNKFLSDRLVGEHAAEVGPEHFLKKYFR